MASTASNVSQSEKSQAIRSLIWNYKVMIEEASKLDESYQSDYTAFLFYDIFVISLPLVERYLKSLSQELTSQQKKQVDKEIDALKRKDKRIGRIPNPVSSPFVLLLKLAEVKNKFRFETMENDNNWGQLASFLSYLKDLGARLKRIRVLDEKSQAVYWPGVPSCVMLHILVLGHTVSSATEQVLLEEKSEEKSAPAHGLQPSHVIISTSNDRYDMDHQLYNKWRHNRRASYEYWADKLPVPVKQKLDKLLFISMRFEDWYSDPKKRATANGIISEFRRLRMVDLKDIPAHLPGILATWTPRGEYMPSCLLDYFRFFVQKPLSAEEIENRTTEGERLIYNRTSCAEWAGFVELCFLLETWPIMPLLNTNL